MTEFVRFLFIGLGNGAVYALIAMALVTIYRSTGLLNFAQGEMAMFCTFVVWTLTEVGLPVPLAMVGGMLFGFVMGAVVHQVVVQPVGDPHVRPLQVVIVTIGLFLGLNALAQVIWGTNQKKLEPFFGNGSVDIAGAAIGVQKLGALGILAVEALLIYLLFTRTKMGLAMRAVASNAESSALCGIPVNRVLMIGWGIAAAVGAVAGTFMAPVTALDANLMQLPLIYGFAAVTLGGFDSMLGAVVGGLLIGVLTDVLPRYVAFLEKMPLAAAFAVILGVLLLRPEGLFGSKKVVRV